MFSINTTRCFKTNDANFKGRLNAPKKAHSALNCMIVTQG